MRAPRDARTSITPERRSWAAVRGRAGLLVALLAAGLLATGTAAAAETAAGPGAETEIEGAPSAGAHAAGDTAAPGGAPAELGATCYRVDAGRVACYETPRFYSFLLDGPLDIGRWLKRSFRRENALEIGGLGVATAGLVLVDQDLSRAAHDTGRAVHVSSTGKQKDIIPGVPIQYPTDLGSGLYYLGDGMVPVGITLGLLGYGLVASDSRALQTTSQLAGGLLSVALVVQTLKHATGRQSPSRATEPGGRWQPLPDPTEYQRNVPAFDAFPSGHVATAMVTITVLADNYPEYRLVRPIGYGLMTLLGFQMMNNDVHWASDYPLALAIGYGIGKTAVTHGRRVVDSAGAPGEAKRRDPAPGVTFLPVPLPGGGGLTLAGSF